ncbi:MAG TPA: DUF1761 domain-containing protein [Rhabdochlamydiaceae bacterium]|nr:DUF1761 domain-containing protein [Rhabdochlamydiaceae bacterium]
MNRSVFLSSFLGGAIAFVWGFISWVVIPWHTASMHRFQDTQVVSEVLAQNAPVDGIYVFHPKQHRSSTENAPFVFASINRTHMNEKQSLPMVRSFIIQVIVAFFISWVLVHTKSRKYWDLVTISAVLGLIGGMMSYLPAWNWWGTPIGYTLVGLIDLVITWFLAGLGMAKLLEKVKVPK